MLRRTECSGIFQNNSFSHPPARSLRGFSSDIYCGKHVELLEVNFTIWWGPYDWVPFYFLTLIGGFSSQVSALVIHDSLLLPVCLSNLEGNGLPCVLPSFMDSRSIVDFSVCSAFYLLSGRNGNSKLLTCGTGNWIFMISKYF